MAIVTGAFAAGAPKAPPPRSTSAACKIHLRKRGMVEVGRGEDRRREIIAKCALPLEQSLVLARTIVQWHIRKRVASLAHACWQTPRCPARRSGRVRHELHGPALGR